jgi:hypothetical protein
MADTAGKFVAIVFLARDLAHREHLRTRNYAAHLALNAFYDGVIPLIDSFAESYMGRFNENLDIPLMDNEFEGEIADVLDQQLAWVEDNREAICPRADSTLHNEIDAIVALYLRTVFLLRRYQD